MIFTAAAAVMLQQIGAIMKYGERARAAAHHLQSAINQTYLAGTLDWAKVNAQIREQEVQIDYRSPSGEEFKIAISNYPYLGVNAPLSIAFAPFQIFDYGGYGGMRLRLVQPGLLPAPNSSTSVIGR